MNHAKTLPKYIDTHAHTNFACYDDDRPVLIESTLKADTWLINVGTKQATSEAAVQIANNHEKGVYAIIGLHPVHANATYHDVDELGPEGKPFNSVGELFDREFYANLAQDPKVVGIGECGLDFFRIPDSAEGDAYIARQRRAFGAQIELALEVDKPLMIHCREAYPEVIQILLSYQLEHRTKLRGNFHFFAGTKEHAQKILDMGFTVSFTGVITFAEQYKELVEYVPLDRMMSETDCPYVTPVPHRGERNEPMYVSEVVKKIAEIKGEDEGKVGEQLVKNAVEWYGL
jgi:TatD DNase family protein